MAFEDFIENSKVRDLLQQTIEDVSNLEEKEQEKILKVFKSVRRELNDRLLSIPDGTFSEQQLRITKMQVDAAIATLNRVLKKQMNASAEVLSLKATQDAISEVEKFSQMFQGSMQRLNINALAHAASANNFLVNKYEASIAAYSESLRSQITSNIITSMALRETTDSTVSRMVSDVGRFFLGEEWRLRRIARTELHGMYGFSKLSSLSTTKDELLPDLKKTLMHPMDARTGEDSKQLALKNPVVDLDKPFVFTYRRSLKDGRVREERREFMFPPDRPNDRSILVPYRVGWGQVSSTF